MRLFGFPLTVDDVKAELERTGFKPEKKWGYSRRLFQAWDMPDGQLAIFCHCYPLTLGGHVVLIHDGLFYSGPLEVSEDRRSFREIRECPYIFEGGEPCFSPPYATQIFQRVRYLQRKRFLRQLQTAISTLCG